MFQRPRINFPLTPIDVKGINDFFEAVMFKLTGNVDMGDMSSNTQSYINGKVSFENIYAGNYEINVTKPLMLIIAGASTQTILLPTKFINKDFLVIPTISSLYMLDADTGVSVSVAGWNGYLKEQDKAIPSFTYTYQIFPAMTDASNINLIMQIGYIIIA